MLGFHTQTRRVSQMDGTDCAQRMHSLAIRIRSRSKRAAKHRHESWHGVKLHLHNVSTLFLYLLSSSWLVAQQQPTPQSILASVVVGMGATNIQGTTLSGSAEFIAGSTDDTGSFTASCAVNGSSQLQLQLGSTSRTETRQSTNQTPTGEWANGQGQQHAMAGHNLFTADSWFCPHIALSNFVQNGRSSIQFVGDETKNGASVVHFTVSTPAVDATSQSAFLSRLSTTEVYLDAQTLRPAAFVFNAHPDNDAKIDIPIEIRFSNYRSANGVWVPHTIQKYVNSSLTLTLQVQTASPSASLQ